MRHALSALVVIAIQIAWTGPASAQTPPTSCTTVSQNLYVRDVLSDLYLWYQFLPSVNPAAYPSPESYLDAVRYRPIDTSYSYITSAAANNAFYSNSQFIGFGFSSQISGSDMTVLHVFDESPALEAGLGRGDRITEVNGQSVAVSIANGTIGSAFGASEVGVAADIVFQTRAGERKQARMVKRLVTIPTVSLTRVVDVDGRRVGYVFFRNFVRPSVAALDTAFAALREARVSELVLDLRYNGGGLVDVAVHLASLIGGTTTAGQLMATYAHNDKNAALNKTLRFDSADQALSLSRLVVITTRSSASASELVVNALRPYMPVIVIGGTTYGKPVGQYGITFCDKVVAPVAFSLVNAAGEGHYYDGIAPTCAALDDAGHDLGDVEEASFLEALTYVRTGACSPAAASAGLALRDAGERPRLSGFRALVNAW